jgi:WhiB family redox-sensing transcriptional regulator
MRRHDWREDAECRDHDPELFFPEGTAGPAQRQADEAKLVCKRCPVRAQCLGFALRQGLGFGIWGGTNVAERRAMRRGSRSGTLPDAIAEQRPRPVAGQLGGPRGWP